MAETTTTATSQSGKKPNYSRRTLRALGRKKRKDRITGDKEFAKKFFEEKAKRSGDRKTAFRKRHSAKS